MKLLHMRCWRFVRILGITFPFVACVTPYQAKGARGGYQDEALGDGTYMLTVAVNRYTSLARAYIYFQRRARDLCVEHGFRSYVVIDGGAPGQRTVAGRVRCTNDPPG